MTLRPEDVRDILAILDSTPYDTLTVRTDRVEVSLRRGPAGWASEMTPLADPTFLTPEVVEQRGSEEIEQSGSEADRRPAAADDIGEQGLVAVTAPVVGTFYRAPRPGAAPFVEVGDHVEPETVVGIIETMKLMTSVPAGATGTVREICIGNDAFAEQGATLLRIAPT